VGTCGVSATGSAEGGSAGVSAGEDSTSGEVAGADFSGGELSVSAEGGAGSEEEVSFLSLVGPAASGFFSGAFSALGFPGVSSFSSLAAFASDFRAGAPAPSFLVGLLGFDMDPSYFRIAEWSSPLYDSPMDWTVETSAKGSKTKIAGSGVRMIAILKYKGVEQHRLTGGEHARRILQAQADRWNKTGYQPGVLHKTLHEQGKL
jgi:hypothetical protein